MTPLNFSSFQFSFAARGALNGEEFNLQGEGYFYTTLSILSNKAATWGMGTIDYKTKLTSDASKWVFNLPTAGILSLELVMNILLGTLTEPSQFPIQN